MANATFEAMILECNDAQADLEKARREVIEELCRECVGDYFMYKLTGSEKEKAEYFDQSSATIKNYGLEKECKEYYAKNGEQVEKEMKAHYEKWGARP